MKRIFYVESKGLFVGDCRSRCYGKHAGKNACVCGSLNWRKGRKKAEAGMIGNLPIIYSRLTEMFDDVVIRFDDGGFYDLHTHGGNETYVKLVEKEVGVINEW